MKKIDLLKSGNFTLAYHDSGYCCLYKGHSKYDDLPEKEIAAFDGNGYGYIPNEVKMLVKALGGKVVSI